MAFREKMWELPDDPEEWLRFTEREEIGDGLPVIPPTRARLAEFLRSTDRDPDEVIGAITPSWGQATVRALAINAIMAGARPESLAVVIAAVQALVEPVFNLTAVQVTTNPVTPAVIVSGPAAARAGLTSGRGYLGPGHRGNITTGRALRLALINIGGALPGAVDRATHGQQAKFGMVLAENEADSPWETLAASRGVDAASALTVTGVASLLNHYDSVSTSGDEVLTNLAGSLTVSGTNTFQNGGHVTVLLGPEHAGLIAKEGLSRADVQRELYERSWAPETAFTPRLLEVVRRRRGRFPEVFRDGMVRGLDTPEALNVVVAGGEGKHSVVCFSSSSAKTVTREIDPRDLR
ncbi:hypothetical protein [Actinophytocola oryzae]|uniref:Uncharacterized protein n=1 Tax=Actinophytocola oryzae TaxID=502181 RepID=A0A4R7W590_9PSEU|nr:hypothetical protein [Actinophytocola oryzae]TDV57732.1 hypothetical protein CLV71_101605 [Actinophytocola oryzae]